MNPDEPWRERWNFVSALSGGGQGDTSVVTNRENPNLKGVLKCLKQEKQFDPKARRRMFQEVSNLKVLHGAGAKVPKVYDDNTAQFEGTETLFFVMEFIEGKTLAATIQERTLNVDEAVNLVLQLCETLRYAFKEKIVHRDIKPENIIVRSISPPDVVMVDFGVARSETDSANLTEVDETFDNKFISLPERRGPDENKRDPRSDLTGICVVLHYCLTKCVPRDLRDSSGRPPHRSSNYTLDKVVQNEVQRSLLNAFFDRGFSWELDARFQALDEIISRLQEVLNPAATSPTDDLADVAKRESILLRKTDRVTQLVELRKVITPVARQWQLHINSLSKKLTNSRFSVTEITPSPLKVSPHGDHLASFGAQLMVHNHNDNRVLIYRFFSIAEECTIVREFGGYMGPTRAYRVRGEPLVIARFAGSAEPPLDLLLKDAESNLVRLIPELSAEIQKKSNTQQV